MKIIKNIVKIIFIIFVLIIFYMMVYRNAYYRLQKIDYVVYNFNEDSVPVKSDINNTNLLTKTRYYLGIRLVPQYYGYKIVSPFAKIPPGYYGHLDTIEKLEVIYKGKNLKFNDYSIDTLKEDYHNNLNTLNTGNNKIYFYSSLDSIMNIYNGSNFELFLNNENTMYFFPLNIDTVLEVENISIITKVR